MAADRPHISRLHKGGFLQRGGQVEIIIVYVIVIRAVERGEFLLIKAGKQRVHAHFLQGFDLHRQQLLVPTSVQGGAVDCQDVGFFLRFRHPREHDIGQFFHALRFRRLHAPMAGEDGEVLIHLHGIAVADAPVDRAELVDLLLAVGTGVIGVRDKLVHGCHWIVLGEHLDLTHLSALPGSEQPLHQIILRGRCAVVICRTVLLHNLKDLVPQPVSLIHILDADVNERRRDRTARGRMLGEEAQLAGGLLTLNPSGRTHGVAFDQVR